MKFTKMHGLGNDYIYINCFETQVAQPYQLARQISNRHFGVGGDGLVLIMPSTVADARMRMFNADGSEAEMCGNAIRCVAKFLYDGKMVRETRFHIETLAGIKELLVITDGDKVSAVRVDMGEPILENSRIPVQSEQPTSINVPITVNDHSYHFTAVSMGNPHCVIFVPEITDAMVAYDGPLLETHPQFPKKTNVEFVKVEAENAIQMRVWERGSGETLACGTGSCASVVAAISNGLTTRQVNVRLLGGELTVEWDEATNHVFMTGPAVEVFQGEWL